MTKKIQIIFIHVITLAMLPLAGVAQTAAFGSTVSELSSDGGDLRLSVEVIYSDAPSAVGWTIVLPEKWSLLEVAGENVPQITPGKGETGELDFAYTSVPKLGAKFEIRVKYPANAGECTVTGVAFVRGSEGLVKVTPDALKLHSRSD